MDSQSAKTHPFVIDFPTLLKQFLEEDKANIDSVIMTPLGFDNWFAHELAFYLEDQTGRGNKNIQIQLSCSIWSGNSETVDILIFDEEKVLRPIGVRVRNQPGHKDNDDLDAAQEKWIEQLDETVAQTKALGAFSEAFRQAVVYTVGVGRIFDHSRLKEPPMDELNVNYWPPRRPGQGSTGGFAPNVFQMVSWHYPVFEKTGQ